MLTLAACESGEKPKAEVVQPVVVRDVHPLLRGTVGAESELRGIDPILVSGFGLVVGLNGTGGDVLPENVVATMEREMSLMGVGRDAFIGTALEGKTPRELLRDPNVAVVIVQAALPPGMPVNARFDIYVEAMNASSLEGGTLFTTDLRLGAPAVFGAVAAKPIAKAKGPVYINPFSEKGRETEGVTRKVGRVLNGGWVTQPNQIELLLDSNSHARARSITTVINSRFPEDSGDRGETARGRTISDSGGSIALKVPRRYRNDAGAFIQTLTHLPIVPVGSSGPEQFAKRYVDGLKAEPAMAEDLSWCLEAVGKRALPFLRELYDYPELAPRMAALKAGARLDDPLAAAPLKDVARTASGGVRTRAISLLGKIDGGPTVDAALRELLAEPELVVRVAAYEALAERASRNQEMRIKTALENNPDAPRMSLNHLELLAMHVWPKRNLQGIERRLIGDKALLDVVPYGDPLIYVTQQGQPRIVVFGEDQSLVSPSLLRAWEDRLLISTEGGRARVRYTRQDGSGATNHEVEANVVALIEFMGRKPSQDDSRGGLGMSYSELVGSLSAISQGGGVRAAFATEQDKLKALVLAAGESRSLVERPERPGDEPVVIHQAPSLVPQPNRTDESPMITPIVPTNPPKGSK